MGGKRKTKIGIALPKMLNSQPGSLSERRGMRQGPWVGGGGHSRCPDHHLEQLLPTGPPTPNSDRFFNPNHIFPSAHLPLSIGTSALAPDRTDHAWAPEFSKGCPWEHCPGLKHLNAPVPLCSPVQAAGGLGKW